MVQIAKEHFMMVQLQVNGEGILVYNGWTISWGGVSNNNQGLAVVHNDG